MKIDTWILDLLTASSSSHLHRQWIPAALA